MLVILQHLSKYFCLYTFCLLTLLLFSIGLLINLFCFWFSTWLPCFRRLTSLASQCEKLLYRHGNKSFALIASVFFCAVWNSRLVFPATPVFCAYFGSGVFVCFLFQKLFREIPLFMTDSRSSRIFVLIPIFLCKHVSISLRAI